MATSSKYDPGTEVNPLSSGVAVPTASFIVGKYDEDGRRKVTGVVAQGPGEAHRINKLLLKSMTNRGELMAGYVMTPAGPVKSTLIKQAAPQHIVASVKPKRGRKAKEVAYTEAPLMEEPSFPQREPEPLQVKRETFPVVFNIETGNIKSIVDAILENGSAVTLVYANEDSISYEPEPGSKLNLILPGHRRTEVMYLGMKFRWYDSEQQLLVFMKTEVDE